MIDDSFFEFIKQINKEAVYIFEYKKSRNIFGNYVMLVDKKEDVVKLNRSNRFDSYLNMMLDETSSYIREKCYEESKNWNSVSGYIRNYIRTESIYIDDYLRQKGFEGDDEIRDTINNILLLYAKLKYFGLSDCDDTPLFLTSMYNLLKLGYLPCGWAGKMPVGGSLYVY